MLSTYVAQILLLLIDHHKTRNCCLQLILEGNISLTGKAVTSLPDFGTAKTTKCLEAAFCQVIPITGVTS